MKWYKEEKRLRVDNQPYGNFLPEVMKRLFTKHPYTWVPIGSMEHLDAATLKEFQDFNKKYYVPNNAVLVIAGDIDIAKTKKLVQSYFGEVPAGAPVVKEQNMWKRPLQKKLLILRMTITSRYPAVIAAYRIPGMTSKETKMLENGLCRFEPGQQQPYV